MEKTKVRFDRAFRGFAEITNKERMHARIVSVPQGGGWNAEDVVELAYPKSVKNVAAKKVVEGKEIDVLEEREVEDKAADPEVVKLLARKYERRTYVRWKGEGKKLVDELGKRGWPCETLAGDCAVIAHPKATSISDLARVVGVKLIEATIELQEPEPD